MSRIIEITKCEDCLYSRFDADGIPGFCIKKDNYFWYNDFIPSWCPLPEKEER